MPGLDFKGKQQIQADHLRVPVQALNIDAKKSFVSKGKKPSFEDNLIIHGDNFKVLKSLIPIYAGRINCIYIDPPYNTGNEGWVYNDNVNSHPLMKEWLKNKNPVDNEDMERHDKWLCLMWRRLKLLQELLSDDGVIFISIDDNEQHRLRMIMDEIFGEQNFISNIVWQKKYAPANDAKYFSDNHDFILCYAKNKGNSGDNERASWKRRLLPRSGKQDKLYKYDDEDGRGPYRSGDLSVKSYSAEYDYPIVNPDTGTAYNPPQGRCWRTSQENMQTWIKENRVFFGKNDRGAPQLKRYLRETQQGLVPLTVWTYDEVGHSDSARREIKEIFHDKETPFENPKPVGLIRRLLQIGAKKDSLILDSFAGSGTTAQAVLELNKEDGGNRKFILIQCEEYDKQKQKPVNITNEITAERLRRVIKGVPKAKKNEKLKEGLGGSFTYCILGEEINAWKMITGESLPSYEALARIAAYTATGGKAPNKIRKDRGPDGFFYETEKRLFYLIYKPDLQFLESAASALNGDRMERIAKQARKKRKTALVYASHKFIGQKELTQNGIIFCSLPYGILK